MFLEQHPKTLLVAITEGVNAKGFDLFLYSIATWNPFAFTFQNLTVLLTLLRSSNPPLIYGGLYTQVINMISGPNFIFLFLVLYFTTYLDFCFTWSTT